MTNFTSKFNEKENYSTGTWLINKFDVNNSADRLITKYDPVKENCFTHAQRKQLYHLFSMSRLLQLNNYSNLSLEMACFWVALLLLFPHYFSQVNANWSSAWPVLTLISFIFSSPVARVFWDFLSKLPTKRVCFSSYDIEKGYEFVLLFCKVLAFF